jgi:hypothetical protein
VVATLVTVGTCFIFGIVFFQSLPRAFQSRVAHYFFDESGLIFLFHMAELLVAAVVTGLVPACLIIVAFSRIFPFSPLSTNCAARSAPGHVHQEQDGRWTLELKNLAWAEQFAAINGMELRREKSGQHDFSRYLHHDFIVVAFCLFVGSLAFAIPFCFLVLLGA